MLYIEYEGKFNGGRSLGLHVGEILEATPPIDDVVSVQADGDELDFIRSACDQLPISAIKKVQTWRGDLAKFVVENIVDCISWTKLKK